MKNAPFAILLICLFLTGCGENGLWFSEIHTPKQFPSTITDHPAPEPSPVPKKPVMAFGVFSGLTLVEEVVSNPTQDIIFLLDNSPSMQDALSLLQNSISSLVDSLANSGMNYRLRFANFSTYYSIVTASNALTTFSSPLSLNSKILSDMSYTSTTRYMAPVFTKEDPMDAIKAQMALISRPPINAFGEEYGIGLAADFLNWASWHQSEKNPVPLTGGDSVHMVLFSNEDVSSKTSGNPLFFYSSNYYEGTAHVYGMCQNSGFVGTDSKETPSIEYTVLQSSTAYIKTSHLAYLDQKSPFTTFGSRVDSYFCTIPSGEWFWYNSALPDTHVCKGADQVWCPAKIDGVTTWKKMNGISSALCTACPPDNLGCSVPMTTDKLVYKDYVTSTALVSDSCQMITCEKVIRRASSIYSIQTNPDKTFSLSKAAIAPEETEFSFPGALTDLVKACPEQLIGTLPEGVRTDKKENSLNRVTPFKYPAGTGVTREQVVQSLMTKYSAHSIVFSREPSSSIRRAYAQTPEDFVAFLENTHSDKRRIAFHSIVGAGAPCGVVNIGGETSDGTTYRTLSSLTGGITADLCSPSYDGFMTKLSQDLKRQVKRRYTLPEEIADRVEKVVLKGPSGERSYELNQGFIVKDGELIVQPSTQLSVDDTLEILYSSDERE